MNASGPRERATFTLSPETRRRLEAAVPKSARSRFVEEAVEIALQAVAKRRALEALATVKGLTKGGEDSTDFLRRKRMEWDGRPIGLLEGKNG